MRGVGAGRTDEAQRREVAFYLDDAGQDVVRVRELHVVNKKSALVTAEEVREEGRMATSLALYHFSGCSVYEAAVVMARWVYVNSDRFVGKRVIELGAGCGLVGLVCARFASQVYITDRVPMVLDNLRYNVALNARHKGVKFQNDISEVVRVLHLEWNDADPHRRQFDPVDIAVGSEVLYLAAHVDLLLKVLDAYLLPGGTFFQICAQDREGLSEVKQKVEEHSGYRCDITPINMDDLFSDHHDQHAAQTIADNSPCSILFDQDIHLRRFSPMETFCFVRINKSTSV